MKQKQLSNTSTPVLPSHILSPARVKPTPPGQPQLLLTAKKEAPSPNYLECDFRVTTAVLGKPSKNEQLCTRPEFANIQLELQAMDAPGNEDWPSMDALAQVQLVKGVDQPFLDMGISGPMKEFFKSVRFTSNSIHHHSMQTWNRNLHVAS